MAKEIIKVDVEEVSIYRTTGGKIAVKRSDRERPSRYFNKIEEAREYANLHFNTTISEAL